MHIKIDKEIKLENPEYCWPACEYCKKISGMAFCGLNYQPYETHTDVFLHRDPKCIEENG